MKMPGCYGSSSRPTGFFVEPYKIFSGFNVFMKEVQVNLTVLTEA